VVDYLFLKSYCLDQNTRKNISMQKGKGTSVTASRNRVSPNKRKNSPDKKRKKKKCTQRLFKNGQREDTEEVKPVTRQIITNVVNLRRLLDKISCSGWRYLITSPQSKLKVTMMNPF
jgi:hypothetical protein